jgi:hypothetical protein
VAYTLAARHWGEQGKAGISGSFLRNRAYRGQINPTSWGAAPLGSNAGVVGQ